MQTVAYSARWVIRTPCGPNASKLGPAMWCAVTALAMAE